MKVIAATGHRPNKLGGYNAEVNTLLRKLAVMYLEGSKPDAVIVGMALGWDMAVAEAAILSGITVHAAVPFQGQQAVWPAESQQRYQEILNCCHSITVVCEGSYAPRKMQVRNEWMVDRSTGIMALWDGSAGGTSNCVFYAQRTGRTIDNLWDSWLDRPW